MKCPRKTCKNINSIICPQFRDPVFWVNTSSCLFISIGKKVYHHFKRWVKWRKNEILVFSVIPASNYLNRASRIGRFSAYFFNKRVITDWRDDYRIFLPSSSKFLYHFTLFWDGKLFLFFPHLLWIFFLPVDWKNHKIFSSLFADFITLLAEYREHKLKNKQKKIRTFFNLWWELERFYLW